jgi:hypothetical protein
MRRPVLPPNLRDVERQMRLIGILDASRRSGMTPLGVRPLHAIAYFADALAPVWDLPVIDGQILKRVSLYYPRLQTDLDGLVGRGVVLVDSVSHVQLLDGSWRPEGRYQLNSEFAGRILEAVHQFPGPSRELLFVQEVVFALCGLGVEAIGRANDGDAMYSDPLVAIGGLIDVDQDEGVNATAQVAMRFGSLLNRPDYRLSDGELINLYVRQLYARVRVA